MVHLPATARPGEEVLLTLAVVDAMGNAGSPFTGDVLLQASKPGLGLPEKVSFAADDEGSQSVPLEVTEAGVYRIRAAADGAGFGLVAETNPLVVAEGVVGQLWGDLHGHSNLSDGTGTPEDYFQYARDVAGLDFVALTDHDHWGMRFIDSHPKLWETIRLATAKANDPERFVTILGYEWTSWLHGHRHVLYFADDGPVLSSMDPDLQTPDALWNALRGQPALTFAHHSAGGPVATNWHYAPDPELEPVTEIVSVHGSSEASDLPGMIYKPVFGNFLREILVERGFTLGFVGSGDSHDGHPGMAHLSAPSEQGGVAAVLAEHNTRDAIREALRARRVYATNGPRIFLRVGLDGHAMGAVVAPAATPTQELAIKVAGVGPIRQVDIVRGDAVADSIAVGGQREWSLRRTIPALGAGEHLYVRVVQEDGGTAWSSPIYVR